MYYILPNKYSISFFPSPYFNTQVLKMCLYRSVSPSIFNEWKCLTFHSVALWLDDVKIIIQWRALGKKRKTPNPKLWNKARNSSLLEGLDENKTPSDAISSRSKRQTKPSEQSDGGRTFVTYQQWIHYSPDKIRRPTFGESKLKFHFSFTSKTKVTGGEAPFIEQHFSGNAFHW